MDVPPDATVLSFIGDPADESLFNHRQYAGSHGYGHRVVDASLGPRGQQVRALHKYEALAELLEHTAPGEIILVLTGNAAIVEAVPVNRLMKDRDVLLVSTSSALPQANVQIWRNCEQTRRKIGQIVDACKLGGGDFPGEEALLGQFSTHVWHTPIEGLCVVMHSGPNLDPRWCVVPTFAISIEESTHAPVETGIVPRFRDALFAHLNHCKSGASQLFEFPKLAPGEAGDRSTFNAGREIAFVTLYTPEIASYGQIAENSFRHYCERQNYTLHVHREIPREIGLSGTGNWLKPWLLDGYLHHHEWVIWLDADILIADKRRRIEPLLMSRDRLLARDIGQWPFNSGIMGFRRTSENALVLKNLMDQIASLPDRSGVYAGDGDQYHCINVLQRLGLLDKETVLNPMTINTPWFMRTSSSFIVHYLGMWTQMRAMMMNHDELIASG
ncbi:galactosyl transferase GMA12/MNN10 domain protein [Paraburkholderia sp. BR14263]|uniref:galactosyl transferase GMA12/MNN10 domain protein n=1 Tax=unclassified Paraburkholderia TaxID=2615204 RepID=UPI0034CFA7C2